jgi:Zn-dependent protease with chaperone function
MALADRVTTAPSRPAARAAARSSALALILGAAGLLAALFVVVRLLERWRVTPAAAAHHLTVLGATLSYPAGNADAIVLLALAALGAVALVRALHATAVECLAQRRLRAWIAGRGPRTHAHDVTVITDPRALAFTAGLLKPAVYVTDAAVAQLTPAALQAVIAHERHHAARRDPLRIAAGRVVSRALWPLPGIAAAVATADRLAELGADEAAIIPGAPGRPALAAAMLTLDGVAPERVDHLLAGGTPSPDWRLPAVAVATAASTLALLAAIALLAGRVASGQATLQPPFLSAQPCVVVLAAIPAAAALLLAAQRLSRRATRRSPPPDPLGA